MENGLRLRLKRALEAGGRAGARQQGQRQGVMHAKTPEDDVIIGVNHRRPLMVALTADTSRQEGGRTRWGGGHPYGLLPGRKQGLSGKLTWESIKDARSRGLGLNLHNPFDGGGAVAEDNGTRC